MAIADFALITFNEHLGDEEGDLDTDATFVGNESTLKSFNIAGTPTGNGYLVLTVFDVQTDVHRIVINGTELGGMDFPQTPAENRWQTHMDKIELDVLRSGMNTIQILRASGGDNFIVRDVVVQWKRAA
jgi:hypothetical protein